MNKAGLSSHNYGGGSYILGFQNVAVGRINGVAGLTGFFCEKMYGGFARAKIKHWLL